MAKVTGLGHFGIFVQDMPRMVDFYTNVLGMTLTDRAPDDRIVFLSARPAEEHHEIALARSQDGQRTDAGQISFRVATLQDLKALYRKLKDYGIQDFRITNHGVAFGCYFRDPEGNYLEVYWPTGMDYPQPHGSPIDLEASDEELLRILDEMPPKEGTGPHLYGRDVGKRITVPAQN